MNVAAEVPLYGRQGIRAYAIIDSADATWVLQHRWHLTKDGYAARGRYNGGGRGHRPTTILMHREILGLEPGDGLLGDHINRERLDNRRSNLRIASRSLNAHNAKARVGSTSAIRGVCWDKQRRKWRERPALAISHAGQDGGSGARASIERERERERERAWIPAGEG